MKLYRVYRVYGKNVLLDMVWAKDENDVYKHMDWEKKDEPKLIIREETKREGAFLCHHIADSLLYLRLKEKK